MKVLSALAALLLLGPGGAVAPRGVWPLQPQPQVVRLFEPPTSAWGRGHRGVDLLGRLGQKVVSSRAGRVVFVGKIAGRGVVVVSHGRLRTTYEPVRALVSVGDSVDGGDPIGRLQARGSHCWPRTCLHWGLLRERTYLNPLTLVVRRVRLLPL